MPIDSLRLISAWDPTLLPGSGAAPVTCQLEGLLLEGTKLDFDYEFQFSTRIFDQIYLNSSQFIWFFLILTGCAYDDSRRMLVESTRTTPNLTPLPPVTIAWCQQYVFLLLLLQSNLIFYQIFILRSTKVTKPVPKIHIQEHTRQKFETGYRPKVRLEFRCTRPTTDCISYVSFMPPLITLALAFLTHVRFS